jgi:hypothetical protein
MYVGAKTLALMRLPVRLVGSAKVATSFGSGTFGRGRASASKMTVAPGPAGVGRRPEGMVSIEQAPKTKTRAKQRKRDRMRALYQWGDRGAKPPLGSSPRRDPQGGERASAREEGRSPS